MARQRKRAASVDADVALVRAVRAGDLAGVRQALVTGADANARAGELLNEAVERKLAGVVELLLSHGADPQSGMTDPMWTALEANDAATLAALLGGGVPPDRLRVDEDGEAPGTPLHIAVRDNRYVSAEVLVRHGASLSIEDEDGYTPLDRAVLANDERMIGLLTPAASPELLARARGAVESQRRRDRYDQLLGAIRQKDVASVTALLDGGVDPNERGNFEYDLATAEAATVGSAVILAILLDRGGLRDGRRRAALPRTPIVLAAGGGHTDCVRLLLDRGADVNANESSGDHGPPLLAAVRGGHLATFHLLVERGARVAPIYSWAIDHIERRRHMPEGAERGPAWEVMTQILDRAVGHTPRKQR